MLVHWQLLRFPFLGRGVFKYLPTIGRARRPRRTQRWASAGRLTAESIRIDPLPFTRIYRELFGATSEQQHILEHRVDLWPRLAVADARSAAGAKGVVYATAYPRSSPPQDRKGSGTRRSYTAARRRNLSARGRPRRAWRRRGVSRPWRGGVAAWAGGGAPAPGLTEPVVSARG